MKKLHQQILKASLAIVILLILVKILYTQAWQAKQIELLKQGQEVITQKDNDDFSPTLNLQEANLSSGSDGLDIILLGKNGALTDSIMILHLDKEKKRMVLLSIPRDLSISDYRINSYFHREGAEVLKKKLSEITGYTMDYFISVDMQAFVDLVNALGGLDFEVPKAFEDPFFPAANAKYQTVSFKKGMQHFTGEDLLKYVRSRKTSSDFDRSARQQIALEALYDSLGRARSEFSLSQKINLIRSMLPYVETDISLLRFVELYLSFSEASLKRGYTPSTKEDFYPLTNESGAYIILPKDKTWKSFHQKVYQYFEF